MKVLILAYDFPPLYSSGGLRPYSWYKYFHRDGLYPIVITRNWSQNIDSFEDKFKPAGHKIEKIESKENLLIKLPHKPSLKEKLIVNHGLNQKVVVRKTLTLLETILKYSVSFFDDKKYIYDYADEFLSANNVDCILATGEPFILFKYAHELSKKYNIPWFADYRDGWSTDHGLKKQGLSAFFNVKHIKSREKKYTDNIAGFSSVSPQVVSEIERVINKKGIVVPNGVDLEAVKSVSVSEINKDKFTIVYTGITYEEQNVKDFLLAYEKFLEKADRKKVVVKFIGINLNPNKNVSDIIELSKKLPENVVVLPRLSHKESIREQKEATILLNFIMGSQSEGLIGAKTYEYLAIKKPIMVIPLKEETKPPLFPNRDIQHFVYNMSQIENLLESFYKEFQKGKEPTTDITDEELYQISREKQALVLAEYIKEIVIENKLR